MPWAMDHTEREGGLGVARSLASNGEHKNWKAVEVRMQQLGFYHADVWFSDALFRGEIDALCIEYRISAELDFPENG